MQEKNTKTETKHIPVLMQEALGYLNIQPAHIIVDATLGGGGYSREILRQLSPQGKIIVFDRDRAALDRFASRLREEGISEENVVGIHANFAQIEEKLRAQGITQVDGIVADFGLSSDQLDDTERGFSFVGGGPLDMRMDLSEDTQTAADIVNFSSEEELAHMLYELAQEKYAKSIARAIVAARTQAPFRQVSDLVSCIEQAVPALYRKKKIHPATRAFMALRMQVNQEIESIERFLGGGLSMLREGGRLAAVTFHSGEDRCVKRFFRGCAKTCVCPKEFPVCTCQQVAQCKILTSHSIIPSEQEMSTNPRARSARLRVAEKL